MKTGKAILIWGGFLCFMFFFAPVVSGNELIEKGDTLYKSHGLENLKTALGFYQQAVDAEPENYEVNWKTARVLRDIGEESKRAEVKDWEDVCADVGHKAMEYAKKATELNPEGVEGYYYYGLSVGVYSDGVSILTALSEGLKDKTQSNFEKAYELDKTFNDGGPMVGLGRFWYVLPWPMRDYDISLKYLREFKNSPYFDKKEVGRLYLSEVLLRDGGDENEKEAFGYLEELSKSSDAYIAKTAKELIEEYK